MSAIVKKIDKSDWGSGPWQSEPDHEDFRSAGFPCILHRTDHSGHWCGYVGVPPGHPTHGKTYDDVAVEVHGGLTYAEKCQGVICHTPQPGESDDVWWFGFDCAHGGDLCPASMSRFGLSCYETYKDINYVREETKQLAEQLAKLAATAEDQHP